ncbi:hypothetical protein [Chitinilyticum litopenaei]|nr:hypothetical protein [Chitinilyticum litopenaei]
MSDFYEEFLEAIEDGDQESAHMILAEAESEGDDHSEEMACIYHEKFGDD